MILFAIYMRGLRLSRDHVFAMKVVICVEFLTEALIAAVIVTLKVM